MSDFQRRDPRPMVPVGVERVLVAAAVDPAFRAELFANRGAAVQGRGLALTPSELAMLKAIPQEQLRQAIQNMDTSESNLKRRAFLGAVAASAVTVIAGESLSGCRQPAPTGSRPDEPVNAQPDMAAPPPAPLATKGIRPPQPDMSAPPPPPQGSGGIRPPQPKIPGPRPPGVSRGIRPRPGSKRPSIDDAVIPPPAHSGSKGGINPDLPEGVKKSKKPENR